MRDPLGKALLHYLSNPQTEEALLIHSDHFDDFEIPLAYFFRAEKEMPALEMQALKLCKGKVLDIGGGAGCHAKWLLDKKMEVMAIDTSPGAIEAMNQQGIPASQSDFWKFIPPHKFDTLLMLMNGLGIMGNLSNAPDFFTRIKQLLAPGGQLLVDSSDLKHLYMEGEETVIELSGKYLGESRFCFEFQKEKSSWFEWIYLEFDLLEEMALNNGFFCEKIDQLEDGTYLARIYQSSSK
jgi:SAM-dependent methyltransferase